MSGYRQSSYDPEAYEQPGRPLTPYNWVQWTGVALAIVGMGLFLLHLVGQLGWIAPIVEDGAAGIIPVSAGTLLIYSRTGPPTFVTEEQRARNKRMLVITLAIIAAIIGGAILINSLSGA